MKSIVAAICLTLGPGLTGSAEPAAAPASPAAPAVERLDDGRLRIGRITLHPKMRSIEFPATVNQTEGLLEFLLVHVDGKVHESLLASEVSATHLNLAFKLLRYQASPELYDKISETGTLTGELRSATEEQKRESRIDILIQPDPAEPSSRHCVTRWIRHAVTEKPMPAAPWVYGGSFFHKGVFMAESSGDLIAIFLRNTALINFSGKDKELDDVWLPDASRVPPIGTPVKVIIQPAKS
jgi:hypothetical protein